LTFSRDELIDIWEDFVDEKWFPKNVDEEYVFDEIIDKTILSKRGQESLAFIHDSFAYFFTNIGIPKREVIPGEITVQLIGCLSADAPFVRATAADALGQLRTEKAINLLVESLKDEDDNTAANAAKALGRIERASLPVINGLINTLSNHSAEMIAANAAEALGLLGEASPPVIDMLINALQHHPAETVQIAAAGALGLLESNDMELNQKVRVALVALIGGEITSDTADVTSDETTSPPFSTRIDDKRRDRSRRNRSKAKSADDIKTLKSLPPPEVEHRNQVISIVKEKNQYRESVREKAVSTLSHWKNIDEQIVNVLLDTLQNRDEDVVLCIAAADAFRAWDSAPPEAISWLAKAFFFLQSEQPRQDGLCEKVAKALVYWGANKEAEEVIKTLHAVLEDLVCRERLIDTILPLLQPNENGSDIRSQILKFIVDIGRTNSKINQAFLRVFSQEREQEEIVRTFAQALIKLNGQSFLDRLEEVGCQYPKVVSEIRKQQV
jgi:HEAT repeat protein